MKKLLILAMAAVAFAACKPTAKSSDQAETDDAPKHSVVAYFSATGTTQGVAELLAQAANADLLKIEPEKAYTDADLDWRDSLSRSSLEMKDLTSRPAITTDADAVADYDTVYVGFPIWWYTAPTIVNTFFETVQLTDKVVIPFATSGGSGIEKAVEDLRASYPALIILDGRTLNDITFEDLSQWVEELKP